MKRTVDIYSCDICGREVEDGKKLTELKLPCEDMYVGRYVQQFEACPKCVERLRKVLYEKFAVINVFNNKVQRVDWKDSEV